MEVETGPNEDTTMELNISTDKSVTSHADDDLDSALGDGISDSQPISGASIMQHRSINPGFQDHSRIPGPEMTFQPLSFSETKSDSVLSQVLDDENNETIEGTQ